MNIRNNLPDHQQKFKEQLRLLPRKLKTEALEHFDKSFELQGFEDTTFQKWKDRELIIRNNTLYDTGKHGLKRLTKKGDYTQYLKTAHNRRGILTLTGTLRRSIKGVVQGNKIIIFSNSPYAQIHNEGGYTGRNHKSLMPKRQFIGKSTALPNRMKKIIEKSLA